MEPKGEFLLQLLQGGGGGGGGGGNAASSSSGGGGGRRPPGPSSSSENFEESSGWQQHRDPAVATLGPSHSFHAAEPLVQPNHLFAATPQFGAGVWTPPPPPPQQQQQQHQHSLQQLSYDPSFAERAAKYSTFGSARYSQGGGGYSSFDTGRLREVLDNETMRAAIPRTGSLSSEDETTKLKGEREGIEGAKRGLLNSEASSEENSSGSAQKGAAPGLQRKRKGSSAAAKEPSCGGEMTASAGNAALESQPAEVVEQTSLKRQRSDGKLKAERSGSENSGDSSPRSTLKEATSKPPQQDQLPKQDYIHVRARRGQATDSHSLAERVRREKISERMKYLQDLVPGCSKVTGKAVMLDEIINYVQSLQRQIEFQSMKLAAVNPRLDYNYEQLLGKELQLQSHSPETTLLGPDPLGYGDPHGHGQLPLPLPHFTMDAGHYDPACLRRSMSVPSMPSLVSDDHFSDPLSQAVSLCNGDLQSVVEMGFVQGRQVLGFGAQLSHGSSMCLPGKLKVELG